MARMKSLDEGEDPIGGRGVKIARRLIRQQQPGTRHQGPSQRDPLLFTAGELPSLVIGSIGETNLIEPP